MLSHGHGNCRTFLSDWSFRPAVRKRRWVWTQWTIASIEPLKILATTSTEVKPDENELTNTYVYKKQDCHADGSGALLQEEKACISADCALHVLESASCPFEEATITDRWLPRDALNGRKGKVSSMQKCDRDNAMQLFFLESLSHVDDASSVKITVGADANVHINRWEGTW